MAARSIASMSLSFGLVSIPVRVYSATESASSVSFNLLDKGGGRLKQQYISEQTRQVVERAEMVKGYEFEKDRFVIFTPDELKALQEASSHSIDIVAFIPEKAVDPLFFDKAYLLAPDKRGGKPYSLLMEAMRASGRCALARWAWKSKQYVVQVRAVADGLVLQQLLYAEEVRSLQELKIEIEPVTAPELKLALQLIDQISQDSYDPTAYKDEERLRILAAIDEKIAGRQVVAAEPSSVSGSGQVIDLIEALRASLHGKPAKAAQLSAAIPAGGLAERKGVRRAPKVDETAAPVRARARK